MIYTKINGVKYKVFFMSTKTVFLSVDNEKMFILDNNDSIGEQLIK